MLAGAEPFAHPGHGPLAEVAVLCVHGLTSTPQMIRPVATALADRGFAVSAPRLPGHGTTWRGLNRTRYEDWATTVEAEAVRLRATHRALVIVGVSLGGALATEVSLRRPGLVDGLVLINPAFAATDPRLKVLPVLQYLLPTVPGIADDIRRQGEPRELGYPVLPLRAFASFVARWPGLLAEVAELDTPILLVRSAHDAVVPPLSAQRFLDQVPARLVRQLDLPNSGHVATLDHDADLVIEQTIAFVEEVTR